MLYATRHAEIDRILLIVAADKLEDFETFANAEHADFIESATGYGLERADILDILGDASFKGYTLAPVKVECSTDAAVDQAIADLKLTMLRPGEAVQQQADMIEFARLAAEHDQPRDRRTLAEVHGLTENDPWDKSSEEQKEAGRKQDEQMKAVREAGGLTGDSFAAKVGEKLTLTGGKVHRDENDEIVGMDLNAIKNSIRPYELTVDGDPVDWPAMWDELKLPESRIISTDGNRVVLMLHDFQTGEIAEVLDRQHRNYRLTKQETVAALDDEDVETMTVEGHEDTHVFYSVQIESATVHEIVPGLGVHGFDTTQAVTMRNIGTGCWFAFKREAIAKECAKLVEHQLHHACQVVAINRQGQSIVAGAHNDQIRIVDTNEHVEIGPRPWNDRAAEYEAMSDDDKAELRKTVQSSEYLIVVEPNDQYRTVVYIVPETYFRETGELWSGEMILDMVPSEREAGSVLLTPLDVPGAYKGGLEPQLMKDNLCRWGFIESMLLRIHINDILSEQRIGA